MNETTKLAIRLILAFSCISFSSAAILLRGRHVAADAATLLTTTKEPLLYSVQESEVYLNNTLNRIEQEMSLMSKQIVAMNQSVRGWRYNHEVIVNTTEHDYKVLVNNTEVLKNLSGSVHRSHILEKTEELDHTIDYQKNETVEISRAMFGITTPGKAHTDVVPRYEKVKVAYDINGTKAENLIRHLRKIESDLLLNETQLVEFILEEHLDTTAASFPDEFQKQIGDVMESITALKPADSSTIKHSLKHVPWADSGTYAVASNSSGIMWQAR
jgi:hypothetical protein